MRAIISGYGCCTRYTISADYVSNGWTFRTEYIHSTGNAFAKTLTDSDEASATDCNLSKNGNKADGFYALGIAPIVANKINVRQGMIYIGAMGNGTQHKHSMKWVPTTCSRRI